MDMRKISLSLILFIASFYCFGQDVIYLRGTDSIVAIVTKITENTIEYKYEGEEFVVAKNKKEIKKVKFKSGREEVFNEAYRYPQINGEEDWEKVIVTYVESEVAGLQRVELMKATSNVGALMGPAMGKNAGYNKCIAKLKKKAASLGACIILVHDSGQRSSFNGSVVVVEATAYK
jgi:hypothetical protein